MNAFKTEGVILHALNYRDFDQILTVFTPALGLIKLMVRGAYSKKNGQGSATTPLTKSEFIYSTGRNDLYNCKEASPIDRYPQLRTRWEYLASAGDMAKAILSSQMPHKPANMLYGLLQCYLAHIPVCIDPPAIAASFRLKLLRHEGLFQPSPHCIVCNTLLTEQYIEGGQSYCSNHAPLYATKFTADEADIVILLTYTRSLTALAITPLAEPLKEKMTHLFQSSFS